MATIKDIARRTGLSLATISKYLNGGNVLERNRIAIEEAIRETNFTVNEFARGLKSNHSRTIGVVIPELSNLFITTILTTVEDILRRNGYSVVVCDCRTHEAREREAVRFLMTKRVEGLINMPVSPGGEHLAPPLDKGIPVVLLDRTVPGLRDRVSSVLVDNTAASVSAVSALTEAGHRRIGIVLGPREVYTSRLRLQGYREALCAVGIRPEEKFITFHDYSVEGGYEGTKLLLERARPSALLVTNYEMTLGAVVALGELGLRIGQDISLIGFDNLALSQVIRPRLTVVTQPLREIGQTAAQILLERLGEGGDTLSPRHSVLPTSLQEGESVAFFAE